MYRLLVPVVINLNFIYRYLTMDHTRKVLLVLESDPKVVNLPLVGM